MNRQPFGINAEKAVLLRLKFEKGFVRKICLPWLEGHGGDYFVRRGILLSFLSGFCRCRLSFETGEVEEQRRNVLQLCDFQGFVSLLSDTLPDTGYFSQALPSCT